MIRVRERERVERAHCVSRSSLSLSLSLSLSDAKHTTKTTTTQLDLAFFSRLACLRGEGVWGASRLHARINAAGEALLLWRCDTIDFVCTPRKKRALGRLGRAHAPHPYFLPFSLSLFLLFLHPCAPLSSPSSSCSSTPPPPKPLFIADPPSPPHAPKCARCAWRRVCVRTRALDAAAACHPLCALPCPRRVTSSSLSQEQAAVHARGGAVNFFVFASESRARQLEPPPPPANARARARTSKCDEFKPLLPRRIRTSRLCVNSKLSTPSCLRFTFSSCVAARCVRAQVSLDLRPMHAFS